MIIGKLRPKQPIHIVGAGISGLVLGHYLKKRNFPFTIYEKSNVVGGIISTKKSAYGLIETAANGIVLSDDVKELVDDLKLPILYPRPKLKRFIHRNGKLKTFPFKWQEIILTIPGLLKKTKTDAKSMNDFLQPIFGKKFCQEVVSTGLRGIYAIGGEELDYEAILPQAKGETYFKYFKNILKKKNGKIQTISFKNGMQDLVDYLRNELEVHLKLNSYFEFNQETKDHNVIFCTDAHTAGNLLKSNPTLSSLLKSIPYKGISSNTIFSSKKIEELDQSFGLLSSTLNSYGILANDQIFPNRANHGFYSYTLIKEPTSQNKEEILEDLKSFGINSSDIKEIVSTNWERGIPCYNLRRKELIKQLKSETNKTSGILFFGNYVGGISLRDIIKNAKQFSTDLA